MLAAHLLTFITGFAFSAIILSSSIAAPLTATDVRWDDGAGAKAVADPMSREERNSFIIVALEVVWNVKRLKRNPFN
jgi:hypothetical protein